VQSIMKLCFIAQRKPSITYGGGKAQYYLADVLQEEGHSVTLIGPEDFPGEGHSQAGFQRFLAEQGAQYDVIDFDHNFLLPEDDEILNGKTLLVARSVLFQLHQPFINYPLSRAWKSRLRHFVTKHYKRKQNAQLHQALVDSLQRADLINLSSRLDVVRAVDCGISRDKVVLLPFALEEEVVEGFQSIPTVSLGDSPIIVFLGTFDFRKGCLDTVKIFEMIRQEIPQARLRILGAKGVFTNEKAIMQLFPKCDRENVELHMRFDPSTLGELIGDATLGLFPSYHEGWGFAIMEQLAAGKPVFAYNAPGASDMLPSQWLGPPGDCAYLANLCIDCLHLQQQTYLQQAEHARGIVKAYRWRQIAHETLGAYTQAINAKVTKFRSEPRKI